MVALPAFGVFQGRGTGPMSDQNAIQRGLNLTRNFDERAIDQQARELAGRASQGDQNALQALLGLKPEIAGQIQSFDINRATEKRASAKAAGEKKAESLTFVGNALKAIRDADPEQRGTLIFRAMKGFEQRKIPFPDDVDPDDPNLVAEIDGELIAIGQELDKLGTGNQFTLSQGQTRFDAQGNQVAAVEPKSDALSPAAEAQKTRIAAAGATKVNVGPDGIDYGKPPKDFAWGRNPDGTVALREDPETGLSQPIAVPVAGGPVEAKRQAAVEAGEQKAAQQQRQTNVVTEDIDRALEIIGGDFPVTGVFSLAQSVPGTSANDVSKLIDTIKSNVGFDKLQAMRDASPTGGALGQVSERENILLQSTIGNLELSQSKEQLQFNLERVKEIYLEIIHGPQAGSDLTPEEQAELEQLRGEFGAQ